MTEPAPRPRIVLDASAALAILRAETDRAAIDVVIDRHRAAGGRLLVPDVFWLEVANGLVRRFISSPNQVVEALRALDDLEIESIRLDRPQLLVAIDLATRHRLSAYDAAYLTLALAEDAPLLTLDARLAIAAGERAIRLDGAQPHRLAEAPTAYDSESVDWSRFGSYLALLRADARAGTGAGAG